MVTQHERKLSHTRPPPPPPPPPQMQARQPPPPPQNRPQPSSKRVMLQPPPSPPENLGAVGNIRRNPFLETNPFKKSSSLPTLFENLTSVYSTFGLNGGDMMNEFPVGSKRVELERFDVECELERFDVGMRRGLNGGEGGVKRVNRCEHEMGDERVGVVRRVNEGSLMGEVEMDDERIELESEMSAERVNDGVMESEYGDSENEIVYVTEVETQTEQNDSDEYEVGGEMNDGERIELEGEVNAEMGSEHEESESDCEIVHVETQTEQTESEDESDKSQDQESVFFSMGEESDISEDSLETTVVCAATHNLVYHEVPKDNGEIEIVIDPDVTFKKN